MAAYGQPEAPDFFEQHLGKFLQAPTFLAPAASGSGPSSGWAPQVGQASFWKVTSEVSTQSGGANGPVEATSSASSGAAPFSQQPATNQVRDQADDHPPPPPPQPPQPPPPPPPPQQPLPPEFYPQNAVASTSSSAYPKADRIWEQHQGSTGNGMNPDPLNLGLVDQMPAISQELTVTASRSSKRQPAVGPSVGWCGIFGADFCRDDAKSTVGKNCHRCRQACGSYFDHTCPVCSAAVCVACLDDLRLILLSSYRCQRCGDQVANREALQKGVWMLNVYRSTHKVFSSIGYLFAEAPRACSAGSTDAPVSNRGTPPTNPQVMYAATAGYGEASGPEHSTRLPLNWADVAGNTAAAVRGRVALPEVAEDAAVVSRGWQGDEATASPAGLPPPPPPPRRSVPGDRPPTTRRASPPPIGGSVFQTQLG